MCSDDVLRSIQFCLFKFLKIFEYPLRKVLGTPFGASLPEPQRVSGGIIQCQLPRLMGM